MTTEKRKEQNRQSQATYRAASKARIDKLVDAIKALIKELQSYKD